MRYGPAVALGFFGSSAMRQAKTSGNHFEQRFTAAVLENFPPALIIDAVFVTHLAARSWQRFTFHGSPGLPTT